MNIMRTLTINGTKYNVTPVVPASSVTLLASAWIGSGDAYYQVVELPGVTPNTKVDLQPTSEQLAEFHNKVLAFVAENEGGVVTVYAIGDKPAGDHTIQTTLTEVEGAGKIRGNTVGTTMPRPDWNQTDPTKADYIKNKEAVDGHLTDASNPHGVTASQVGARPDTWSPTPAEIGAVAKSELKALAYSNTDENGDTTADGIKSYPTTPGVFRVVEPVAGLPSGSLGYGSLVIFDGGSYWLHLHQDVEGYLYWARTANSTTDNSVTLPNASSWHRIYDNVNKPTASDVGAVPAGYGYGESLTYISKTDTDGTNLENYLDANFVLEQNKLKVFRFSNLASYPNCAVSNLGGYADLHVANALYCELVGYFYTEHGGVSVARKLKNNGTWYPWEYENPPMEIGEEYRTTERWNGKAVYTKLIDLGIVPAGEKEVDTGIFGAGSGNNGFIRHYAFTATGRSVLPHGTNVGDWEVSVNIHDGKAGITGGSGIGSNNELLYLQMWYIKP